MKSDIALVIFTVVFLSIAGFYILRESPAEKATYAYNKQLNEACK